MKGTIGFTDIREPKPTVTKKWVDVQAAELMGALNEYGGKTGMLHVLRSALPEILKEAGVKITGGK